MCIVSSGNFNKNNMTGVTRKGILGHFQNAQPKTSRRVIDAVAGLGLRILTRFSEMDKCFNEYSTPCYRDRKMNVRNKGTDLQVHFVNNLKMSECHF